jgi:hypothetical protein
LEVLVWVVLRREIRSESSHPNIEHHANERLGLGSSFKTAETNRNLNTRNVMGTWGKGSFENDWALDWLADLYKSHDASLLLGALTRVIEHGCTKHMRASFIERLVGRRRRTDWLTAGDSARAIAAAEVVAVWRGNAPETIPERLSSWAESHRDHFRAELVSAALKAVEIVRANSELKDLWDQGGSSDWAEVIRDLEQRLQVNLDS